MNPIPPAWDPPPSPRLRTLTPACVILDPWPRDITPALDLLERDAALATIPVIVSSTGWRVLERVPGLLSDRGDGSICTPFAIDNDLRVLRAWLVGRQTPVSSPVRHV